MKKEWERREAPLRREIDVGERERERLKGVTKSRGITKGAP